MALRWIESFETYGTEDDMDSSIWISNGGFATRISQSIFRTGTRSLAFLFGFSGGSARRSVGATAKTIGCGFALRTAPGLNENEDLFQFVDAANVTQLSLSMLYDAPSGRFRLGVRRGEFTGTLLGQSDPVFDSGVFEHIEIKATIDATAGAVEVRLNGVVRISLTNVNTEGSDNDQIGFVRFGPSAFPEADMYYDDVFVWDDSGTTNNDFIGDMSVFYLKPSSDTAQSDFVRNTGTSDFAAIDENDSDEDATYIESDNINDISEFGLQNLPPEALIVAGCQIYYRSRKTDSGVCDLLPSLVSNGAVASGDARVLGQTYEYQGPVADVIEIDPDTGAPWTPAAIDAALLRFERTA